MSQSINSPSAKRCGTCKRVLLAEVFGSNRASRDGLNSRCRDCRKVYREKHADVIKQRKKAYHAKNRDKILAGMRRRNAEVYAPRMKAERQQQSEPRRIAKRQRWEERRIALHRMYAEEYRPLQEIAAHFGIAEATIYLWLHKLNIPLRDRCRPRITVDKTELERLYVTENLDGHDIAARLGVSADVIYYALPYYGIPIRRPIEKPSEERLRWMYLMEGLTIEEIAAQLGAAHDRVSGWINEYGFPKHAVPGSLADKGIEPPSKEVLHDLIHGQNKTLADIGKMYGNVSAVAVSVWIRKLGIPVPPPRGWSGKRYQASDGHMVRSSYERKVDDWLSENGIEHEYDPILPFGLSGKVNRKCRADFKVGCCFVEIWGMTCLARYRTKMEAKIALYEQHHLQLIGITEDDFLVDQWVRILENAFLDEPPINSVAHVA